MPAIGEYRWGVLLLKRQLAAPDGFGEPVESWPEDGAVRYPAKLEELNATEQLAGAVRQSNETVRVTIRKPCPVAAVDRLKREDTGEVYRIGGLFGNLTDVFLSCELVRGG
jgi:head-tail adaptor